MTVTWQNIEMPLGGADRYTDSPHVLPGKMERVNNVRLRRPPTHSKRYGVAAMTRNLLASSSSLTEAKRLVAHGKETLLCDSRHLYTYSATANEWTTRGILSPCHVERRNTWSDLISMPDWDGAVNQNILVLARGIGTGFPSTTLNVIVVDTTTDTVLSAQRRADGTVEVFRVVAVGNYIYLISNGGSYSRIDVTSGDYTFPTFAAFTGISGINNTAEPDAMALSSTELLIAYRSSAGAQPITVHRVTVSNNTSAASNSFAETPANTIAVYGTSGEGVLVVWDTAGTALRAWNLNTTTLAQVVAPANIGTGTAISRASIGRVNSGYWMVVWSDNTASPDASQVGFDTYARGSGPNGAAGSLPEMVPASKLFTHNSRVYGWTTYASQGGAGYTEDAETDGGDQETFYLLEYSSSSADQPNYPPIWMATAARGVAEGPTDTNFLPQVYDLGSSRYEFGATIKYKFNFAKENDTAFISFRTRIERVRADFGTSLLHMSAQWGRGRVFAGGRPSWYDGNTCTELGFAWRPEYIGLSSVVSGVHAAGDLFDAGFCYEWTDALGNIHRSAPQFLSITIDVGDLGFNLLCHETLLTNKTAAALPTTSGWALPRLVGYRSIEGPGPTLYRSGPGFTASTDDYGKAAERSIVGYSMSVDTDADILERDVLYTTGGVLDNSGVPPCKLVVEHNDRLWLGGLEEPDLVWFSQPYVQGEGPRFNETLSLRLPFEVTALASMDAKLVAFGSDAIAVVDGQGPPATGGLDVGYVVYDVPSDVGCVDWRSVAVYRDGVVFQSRKGIYKLGRDLSVSFVGAPVKSTLDEYTSISGAVVLADRSEIIFTRDSSGGEASFVWNYEVDEWTVDVRDVNITSAAVLYNVTSSTYVFSFVTSTGVVYREDTAYVGENGGSYNQVWYTPWLKLNTLQDWCRIKGVTLLGNKIGTFGLTVVVHRNYDGSPASNIETHTFTSTQVANATVNGKLQLEIPFETMRCESIRITITENSTSGGGLELQSLVWTGGFAGRDRFRVGRENNRVDGTLVSPE